MLTFRVERFQDIAKELAPLFVRHWHESALDKDKIMLAPDWERYGTLQDQGILHIVTVRRSDATTSQTLLTTEDTKESRLQVTGYREQATEKPGIFCRGFHGTQEQASQMNADQEAKPFEPQSPSSPEQNANQGKLVGYYFAMILPHLHYSTAGPMAYPDAYYILPQFRKGGAGAKLLAEMEQTLWEKGVVKIYLSTKVHTDHGALFERMGYKLTDKVYTKIRP